MSAVDGSTHRYGHYISKFAPRTKDTLAGAVKRLAARESIVIRNS